MLAEKIKLGKTGFFFVFFLMLLNQKPDLGVQPFVAVILQHPNAKQLLLINGKYLISCQIFI